jgi:hypothetical protein
MAPPAHHPARCSVRWTFVIQCQSDTAVEQGHLPGQVEHVISGQEGTSLCVLISS